MEYKIINRMEEILRGTDKDKIIERILIFRNVLNNEAQKAYEHFKYPRSKEIEIDVDIMDAQGYFLGVEWASMKFEDAISSLSYEVSEDERD